MEADFGFGRFQRTYAKAGTMTADAAQAAFDDSGWARVQVPHDWAVTLPFAAPGAPTRDTADALAAHGYKAIGRDFPQHSVGWYRRPLPEVTRADAGRRVWLEFDGVFRDCLVFVNGYVVGRSESGYAPFRVDISDYVDTDGGPNVLALRADASLGEGWFYEGAGIYRNVRLVSAAAVHVPQWGVFVRSEPDGSGARVQATTELANAGAAEARVTLRQAILAPDGVIAARLDDWTGTLAAGQQFSHDAAAALASVRRWAPESPQLYRLASELHVDGVLVDRVETPFGVRAIRFDAEQGFFLDDRPVKLLGTCNHHDHAGVGTGIPDRLHAWRVEQLQAMGSNAWRSAHNPPAEALLEACDRLGMLMIVEARWNSTEPEAMAQLERIVRRDRNHPCVILWSVGNEEPHAKTARGATISAEMVAAVRALDPTRPTTQAFDNAFTEGAAKVVDVVGFNYRTDQMPGVHATVPGTPILGSETGSTVATRGAYANDEARHVLRAYDTEHPWWATTAEEWWTIAAAHPYIAGGFVWTGFDYRGEPTPYAAFPSIHSYFGILDLCGFPKDNYWYYRAWWRPSEPLVHVFPHWTWPGREGQPIEAWVHGNTEDVELLLNGASLGRKRMERNRHLAWQVPYAPGTLEAVGYIGGRRVASSLQRTAGPAHAVELVADRRRIASDGRDLAVLRAQFVDRRGTVVPDSDALVRFEVAGPGRLIGVGNGDPTSLEPDQATQRRAFHGLCQALVQSRGGLGPIRVRARADGLEAGEQVVVALPPAAT
jgi:beta-galactosidase